MNSTIPKRHKALIYRNPGTTTTEIIDIDTPEPDQNLEKTHSGVCHSDYGIIANKLKHALAPPKDQIGGYEGVGVVVKLGANVTSRKIGGRVGMKWYTSACLICEECMNGDDSRCPKRKVSGYKMPGTFQHYMTSDTNYVAPIPAELDSAEAAPLLCGVTVYVALKKANLTPAQWVALSGAGGELEHLAIQYAKSFGLQVLAIDDCSKRDFCLPLGADSFIDFKKFDDEVLAEFSRGVNNASTKAYDQALNLVRFCGTLICVGVPEGDANPIAKALPWYLIMTPVDYHGGNRKDAVDCLGPAARGQVRMKLHIEPMNKLAGVFDDMAAGKIHGRVALDLSRLD